jgi:hypothetical protein
MLLEGEPEHIRRRIEEVEKDMFLGKASPPAGLIEQGLQYMKDQKLIKVGSLLDILDAVPNLNTEDEKIENPNFQKGTKSRWYKFLKKNSYKMSIHVGSQSIEREEKSKKGNIYILIGDGFISEARAKKYGWDKK